MDDLEKRTGLNVPVHVDAASGGFVAPFAYPDLKWAFDVPRVVSINTSGHKFGLVYPGLGWILWRDEKCLHKDLVFELREFRLFLFFLFSLQKKYYKEKHLIMNFIYTCRLPRER